MNKFRILIEGKIEPNEKINFDSSGGDDLKKEEFFQRHAPNTDNARQQGCIHDYTLGSTSYNRQLWGVDPTEKQLEIQSISNGLKTAKPAEEDFHVYTGINGNKNKLEKGDLHIPAFTSASSSIHVAGKFVRTSKFRHTNEYHPDKNGNMINHTVHHILKIHVKKGQHVGAYITKYSNFHYEHEFLIDKGHTIHVSGDYEDHHMPPDIGSDTPRIYRVHHVSITMDDEK